MSLDSPLFILSARSGYFSFFSFSVLFIAPDAFFKNYDIRRFKSFVPVRQPLYHGCSYSRSKIYAMLLRPGIFWGTSNFIFIVASNYVVWNMRSYFCINLEKSLSYLLIFRFWFRQRSAEDFSTS